jgi:hypothetical protein
LERIHGYIDANVRTLMAIMRASEVLGVAFEAEAGIVSVRLAGLAGSRNRPSERDDAAQPLVPLLHRIVFYSTANRDRPQALDQILMLAEARNAALDLTGRLLFGHGRFLQALEGPKPSVHLVFGAICADPRHSGLEVVQHQKVSSRVFADWRFCDGHRLRLDNARSWTSKSDGAWPERLWPEGLSPAAALDLLSRI